MHFHHAGYIANVQKPYILATTDLASTELPGPSSSFPLPYLSSAEDKSQVASINPRKK
jgi:hypothetical protein